MAEDMFISNVPDELVKKVKSHLEHLTPAGRKRGDLRGFVISAIKEKLDQGEQHIKSIVVNAEECRSIHLIEPEPHIYERRCMCGVVCQSDKTDILNFMFEQHQHAHRRSP